jgi:hypothetical protein
MQPQDFRRHYEQLTDDELLSVAADSGHLVPEAAAGLNAEIGKRGTKLPEPTRWMRQPDSAERVESLQDYDQYRQLCRRKQFMGRYYYVLATAPFILGLVLGRKMFENSVLLIGLTINWAMLVVIYGLALNCRWTAFRCPQCSHRFGTDDECSSCGFPRSPKPQLRSS